MRERKKKITRKVCCASDLMLSLPPPFQPGKARAYPTRRPKQSPGRVVFPVAAAHGEERRGRLCRRCLDHSIPVVNGAGNNGHQRCIRRRRWERAPVILCSFCSPLPSSDAMRKGCRQQWPLITHSPETDACTAHTWLGHGRFVEKLGCDDVVCWP